MYEEYNDTINGKYAIALVVLILIIALGCLCYLACQSVFNKRPDIELENYLAVALAQIHTMD